MRAHLLPSSAAKVLLYTAIRMRILGGKGSGNFGHGGRPGERGGSSDAGGDASKPSPVSTEQIKAIHDLHESGKGNAAIAKQMGWHYSEGKRVQRVIDTYHPDGTQKLSGGVTPPTPRPEPTPKPDVPPVAPPERKEVEHLSTHERQRVEITQMEAQLKGDRVRMNYPYSMDVNTPVGRQNIALVHTGMTSMLKAREDMRAMGVRPPGVVMAFKSYKDNAYAYQKGKSIVINTKHESWMKGTTEAFLQRDYEAGWHPAPGTHTVLVHEMAHALHRQADRGENRGVFYMNHPVEEHISRQVSRYAMTNHKEFVAETFTGLVAGRNYSSEVMTRYAQLKGPAVKKSKSTLVHTLEVRPYDRSDARVLVLQALRRFGPDAGGLQGLSGGDSASGVERAELSHPAFEGGSRSAVLPAAGFRVSGGKGSGNFGHGGRPGERGGSDDSVGGNSKAEKVRNERSLRALKAFIPTTAQDQRYAEKNELVVRSMVGGRRTNDNLPVDVIAVVNGKTKGIEVKTMLSNTNDKITMRKAAIEKKDKWGRSNHASVHTVVLDDRGRLGKPGYSGHRIYYAKGSGSFRLASMTKVTSAAHLKELLSK